MDMPEDYRTDPEQENYTPFRAKLEFDMPMARDDLKLALYGKNAFFLLQDLDNELRNKLKHGDMSAEKAQAYEEIREGLHNLMDEEGLSFDMVS